MASSNQDRHTFAQDGITTGFFMDPTLCIGCNACELACQVWNELPPSVPTTDRRGSDFAWSGGCDDNTRALGASSWRHVKSLEVDENVGPQDTGPEVAVGWTFLSDSCRHCEVAGCLEACPTGSIFRTEIGSVYIQDDVCNGCGYCIVSCPFGVIDQRNPSDILASQPTDNGIPGEALLGGLAEYSVGGAFKCTSCYDRQLDGLTPACAKTCPTKAIQFGPLDELRQRARLRIETLRERGYKDVRLDDSSQTSIGGTHAFSLLPGDYAERFGLPPHPESPTIYLRDAWLSAFLTIVLTFALCVLAL
ncbi:MAG: 4Fe-4S dicluster domain-containing protein [Planctomycetota bacterium]|nr:4Fe-4S dicluster domain-containing protein [Planctomycetota bacterium]